MQLAKFCVLTLGLFLCACGNQAGAQDPQWAHKMFDKLEQDFGVVPGNADVKARIKITNKYKETVHILAVTPGCSCAGGKPSKETLESEESTFLELTMDTRRFRLLKETYLEVTFDRPIFAVVRIPVKAFISPDVLINPGAAEFGSVAKGSERLLRLAVAYAGRGVTSIKEAVCKNPNLAVKLVEIGRVGVNINYELHVTLKGNAPVGEIRDQVILVTDDPNNRNIPVLVEARIEPEFIVSPELVSFGALAPGERREMRVIIRSSKRQPFTIEKIESEKTAGTFETRIPKEARELHNLPLTFIAPKEAGAVNEEFTVTVSGSAETITFRAKGNVVAGAGQVHGGAAAAPQQP